ncbi:MAG: class II glutamine amidotransferase [Clostridia bacterium]
MAWSAEQGKRRASPTMRFWHCSTGQEGAGIALLKDSSILCHKDVGLVSEVFSPSVLSELPDASEAIGHVRYSTTGNNTKANVQPIVKEYLEGRIAVAHNGNIVNAAEIRERLLSVGCDFTATNDSEAISLLIAYEALHRGSIEAGVAEASKQLKGAFSCWFCPARIKSSPFGTASASARYVWGEANTAWRWRPKAVPWTVRDLSLSGTWSRER